MPKSAIFDASLFSERGPLPTAHCVSTVDGVILEVDAGFLDLVRRPEVDVVGASYTSITYRDDLNRSAKMLASLAERTPPKRLQKRYVRPDGEVIIANIYVTKFSNPERLISTLFWNDRGRRLPPARLWEAALRMRRMHESRVNAFGQDLSTDPVGTLLTSLYLAEAEGRIIGLPQIATEARLLQGITRRWLGILNQRGVVGSLDNIDTDVQLTQAGIASMEGILASAFDLPTMPPLQDRPARSFRF